MGADSSDGQEHGAGHGGSQPPEYWVCVFHVCDLPDREAGQRGHRLCSRADLGLVLARCFFLLIL